MLECADGTLYTGCTNDLERRVTQHNEGTGAKYTRGRGPVRLVYSESTADRSAAQQREYEIKQLQKNEKKNLAK